MTTPPVSGAIGGVLQTMATIFGFETCATIIQRFSDTIPIHAAAYLCVAFGTLNNPVDSVCRNRKSRIEEGGGSHAGGIVLRAKFEIAAKGLLGLMPGHGHDGQRVGSIQDGIGAEGSAGAM